MGVQVTYPGVYVQEISSGVRTITGVSTSVTAFLGMTSRGPIREPTRVLSFSDYERTFGADSGPGEMGDQVLQFFQNGGQQAFITRIADGALEAQVELRDETASDVVLTLEARSAGVIGETLRVSVDYDTASAESTFNLTVTREEADSTGAVQVVETEVFTGLSMNPAAGTYVINVLEQQSALVSATLGAVLPATFNGYSLAGVLQTGTTINELVAAVAAVGGVGRFQISVDGSAFVTAAVDPDNGADVTQLVSNFQDRINLALAPLSRQVTASIAPLGALDAIVIASATAGGSVAIAPALTEDIAVAMQMGVAQGGLEVDGFAGQRPAPSGYFSVLGTGIGDRTALSSFVGADPATITQFDMTDANGAVSVPGLTWPAAGNADMSFGTAATDRSLRNAAQNLQSLVDQLNADANLQWSVDLHGFRVVLTPEFGDADADTQTPALIATSATDLGAAGQILGADPNTHQYRLGSFPLNTRGPYQSGPQAGFDGSYPKLTDYQDAFLDIDREVDLFNLMVLPRANSQGDADRALLWGPASVFCLQRRAFLIIDPPSTWTSADDTIDGTTGVSSLRTGLVNDHAAVYWPRFAAAGTTGVVHTIDPGGSIAGMMARTDSNRGVWKAPAGLEASFRGVTGVEHTMSDAENGIMNPEAVNAIRLFPNGIVSWGARTMDGFDTSGNNDYKYVPVRRIALFIEESLRRGLQFAVFEGNDEPLWAQIRLAAGAFMNNLFRQGAFQGQTKSEAYFVKVDSETTTQNDINLGIVNVLIGFAPLKPAEFVVITIQQMAGQIQT